MAANYDFGDQLRMSEGVSVTADVKDILMQNIPGALNVIKSHATNDRTGVDWWIEVAGARFLAVDAKVRAQDWAPNGCDDLALEIWSVVEQQVPGWTRSPGKTCDYVLWLWKDTGRFCLIPFQMLCKVFRANWQQWAKQYKTAKQFTPRNGGGYHSECVFVDRRAVWAAIYQDFGGAPEKTGAAL